MRRTLVIAGYVFGMTAALFATADEPRPASSGRDALSQEFTYATPHTSQAHDAEPLAYVDPSAPVIEMSPFRVEEMRPRHAHDLREKWNQRERLRPKAAFVNQVGPAQVVLLQVPYLHDAPSASSAEVGAVMVSVPVLSLRW